MTLRGALMVEGHGENTAAPNLLNRLWSHLQLQPEVRWERPIYRNNDLKNPETLLQRVNRFRGDLRRYSALFVLYDADYTDACPMRDGPRAAQALRDANLPIPAAVVLAWPEYEHWIAASLPAMQGRPVVDPSTQQILAKVVPDCSAALQEIGRRDGKGVIRRHLDNGDYKETTHQLALTALLDFNHLQKPEIDALVPAFGTLCRACQFIARELASPIERSRVYP